MIRRLDLSVPVPEEGGLLNAPAAARNMEPILDALLPRLPRAGDVLELASGTGQHVAAWAAHRPDLIFHPTDPDPTRRAAIDARCRGLSNVVLAGDLDACRAGWARPGAARAVVVVNLLHLISDAEMAVLLDEAARVLEGGGVFAAYGPFLRGGATTSDGDAAFDADLRAQDPEVGFKDVGNVTDVLEVLGLDVEVVEMPANNLMVFARSVTATL